MTSLEARDKELVPELTEIKTKSPLTEELLLRKTLLEQKMGLSNGRLRVPSITDRACDTEKGLCVYNNMPSWGLKFPLSDFVQSLLQTLNISLGQISGASWCYINSFEHLFTFFADKLMFCRVKKPTVNLFFHYYTFILDKEKSWLLCCKRRNLKLLKPISKIADWKDTFFFLPPDNDDLDSQWRKAVNPSWNLKINIPGRRKLSEEEKKVVRVFYEISKGTFRTFPSFKLLYYY